MLIVLDKHFLLLTMLKAVFAAYFYGNHNTLPKHKGQKKKIIQQGCIKLIKSDSKEMYNVTKDLYFK